MKKLFSDIASKAAGFMGHPVTFLVATATCLLWAVSGPMFHYSDTWQLVINTATTVLTFLAVFLIQNSQNRDGAAMQVKLDEILRAISDARSGFVGIEKLTDAELAQLKANLENEVLEEIEASRSANQPSVDDLLGYHTDIESKRKKDPAGT